MNKETRSWITGIIMFLGAQYVAYVAGNIKDNGETLIIVFKVVCWLFFIIISGYGITLVLNSIKK